MVTETTTPRPRGPQISVVVTPEVQQGLQRAALKHGTTVGTLAREWLADALREDLPDWQPEYTRRGRRATIRRREPAV